VPTNAPNGLDTDLPPPPPISWENRGILIPINPPSEDQAGSSSSPGTGTHARAEDGDDDPRTWHDVALSIAAELMDEIRVQVRIRLGYTTSAVGISLRFGCYHIPDGNPFPIRTTLQGIARNKFLAKVRHLSTHSACTSCSCKATATHSSPHRTKSGTRRLCRSEPLQYRGAYLHSEHPPKCCHSQLSYTHALPKGDSCPIVVETVRCPQRAQFRLGSWVANSGKPLRKSSRFLRSTISCMNLIMLLLILAY
jgi:hypothetical protein